MDASTGAASSEPSGVEPSVAVTPGVTSTLQSGVLTTRIARRAGARRRWQMLHVHLQARPQSSLQLLRAHGIAGAAGLEQDTGGAAAAAPASVPGTTPPASGYASPTPRRQRVSGESHGCICAKLNHSARPHVVLLRVRRNRRLDAA